MAKNEFDITSLTPEQRDARLALDVERLLRFGRKHKLIKDLDILVARNTLLDLLAWPPQRGQAPEGGPRDPAALLDEMVELAAQKELFDGAVNQYRINFETRLMGALMPRESEVCKKFRKLYVKQAPRRYRLVLSALRRHELHPHRADRQEHPVEHRHPLRRVGDHHQPDEAREGPQDDCPRAPAAQIRLPRLHALQGEHRYAGRINFPARQTHRIVPITLAGEQFYLQYSPYAYFHEHCIMLHEQHKPMEMNKQTLAEIFDFVGQSPTTPAAPTPTCPSWAAAS